jgi:hypothetical protein
MTGSPGPGIERWHEIDDHNAALIGFEHSFQDQAVPTIGSGYVSAATTWRDQPSSIAATPTCAKKQAGLSKRGQHSQSIEPIRRTIAQVEQSPMMA